MQSVVKVPGYVSRKAIDNCVNSYYLLQEISNTNVSDLLISFKHSLFYFYAPLGYPDFCHILTGQRSIDVTQVAPGLYMYEAPMIPHSIIIRAPGFRPTAVKVNPRIITVAARLDCAGK